MRGKPTNELIFNVLCKIYRLKSWWHGSETGAPAAGAFQFSIPPPSLRTLRLCASRFIPFRRGNPARFMDRFTGFGPLRAV